MLRLFVLPAVLVAIAPLHSPYRASVQPLSPALQSQLRAGGYWHRGCPVALSDLRVLSLPVRGWDGHTHTGHLIVNRLATGPLTSAFRQLYALHFPIRHAQIADMYGPIRGRPRDDDVTGSFSCRQAVPSPCTGGTGTGSWSMHAYGLAVDVNPLENPYVGCGQSRDPATRPFFDRTRHRKGMVTGLAVRAFASAGWGWGGSWTGDTKDYMHFSSTGH